MRQTKNFIALFVFLAALLLSSGAFFNEGRSDTQGPAPIRDNKQRSAQGTHVIPIKLLENHIYVNCLVNGSPLNLVLDTGATNHFLNERRAKELGLLHKQLGESKSIGTGEGTSRLAAVKNVSLNLSGIELKQKTIYVVPMESLEAVAGHPIDGILGAEVFNRFVVQIDYLAQTISLSDPENYKYSDGGDIIPLKLADNRPFVKTSIAMSGLNQIEGLFVIDTGAGNALSLHTLFVTRNKLLAALDRFVPHFTNGMGGESREWLGRVECLRLGGYMIKQPLTAFSQAMKGSAADSSYDGAIGGEILRRFKIIFDYTHRQLILERNADFDKPFETDMSGASLLVAGDDFKTIKVNRVIENSPAAESGLRDADVITAIDGNSTAGFTLAQIKQMFAKEGQKYLLSIRRGNQMLQVKIKMRKLI